MDAEQDIGIAWRGRLQLTDGHTDKRLTGNGYAGDNPDDWGRRVGRAVGAVRRPAGQARSGNGGAAHG